MKGPNKESSLDRLSTYAGKKSHWLIGIMSGTSFDGIDAVLVRFDTTVEGGLAEIKVEGHVYVEYATPFRDLLLRLCSPKTARLDDLVYLNFALSEWYANAVNRLLRDTGKSADSIDALCVHGQTVWHAPEPRNFPGPEGVSLPVKGTLQIGSAPLLHERTGIPVVYDFRSRDMAAGGEGAPLAPYADTVLFRSVDRGRIVQNIGGIGNATVLPPGKGTDGVFAFDTGPGNMVIDGLVKRYTQGELAYDGDGKYARAGKVDDGVVGRFMEDPYFSRLPPKSTGREVYGDEFVDRFMDYCESKGLSKEDTIATATAFTAESIVRSYKDFVFPFVSIQEVIVGGGGACNPTLMEMIRVRLPQNVSLKTTADYGVPVNLREAIAFALLGHEALMGHNANLPRVTGASRPVVLGCLTL